MGFCFRRARRARRENVCAALRFTEARNLLRQLKQNLRRERVEVIHPPRGNGNGGGGFLYRAITRVIFSEEKGVYIYIWNAWCGIVADMGPVINGAITE